MTHDDESGSTTRPIPLGPRFDDALRYAVDAHRHQWRKGTAVPYAAHLLDVCALVLTDGGGEDEAIAAVLHDAVEDQGGAARLHDIETRFGEAVAGIVAACTDTDEDPKPPWEGRKQRYLAHLRDEPRGTVLRVSLADKLSNARAICADLRTHGKAVWSRFNAGRDGQLWYYGQLAEIFSARCPDSPMASELARVVASIRALAEE